MSTRASPRNVARRKPLPSDTDPNGVAAKLGRLIERKAPGVPYREIAERAGMSLPEFSHVVRGRNENPKLDTLTAILTAIGANLCDFHKA